MAWQESRQAAKTDGEYLQEEDKEFYEEMNILEMSKVKMANKPTNA